ncbi:MAG TPA: homoserine O-succinyltransferase [Gemmataceae bacterium]|nr:homoserine O-succinyltransferase [Gemmataceae bacterium]
MKQPGSFGTSLYICWAAQAALHHFHGIPKHRLAQKMFGIFGQRLTGAGTALLRGFGGEFPAAVSRHTEVRAADLPIEAKLSVLAASPDAGLCLLGDRANRAVYMFNHLEYDAETLRDEFLRDRLAGRPVRVPQGYFPENDPARAPVNVWRPYGQLLFANWLEQIQRAAQPRPDDEPVIQWALASSRTISPAGDHADLLVSAAGESDVVASALRVLAEAGLAPRAVKVHRLPESGQFIELRLDRLQQPAIEEIAQRLCRLPMISKVAFRSGGNGGWAVGHGTDVTSESRVPSGPSTPCEAA